MRIVKDGWPLIIGSLLAGGVIGVGCRLAGWERGSIWFFAAGVIACAFFLYFFRDPERQAPADPNALVAGADGLVRAVEIVPENKCLKCDAVRISIFLNPFDVHVNRSPIGGTVKYLDYTPGKHLLTVSNASSEHNEHSTILVEGEKTRCMVRQIVGPIVRRVVYWLALDQRLNKGDRIGMMKFGSRLDMHFPKDDVTVVVKKGDRVRAGETVVAMISKG
jgi:phosphatidylserine decarboxylase